MRRREEGPPNCSPIDAEMRERRKCKERERRRGTRRKGERRRREERMK